MWGKIKRGKEIPIHYRFLIWDRKTVDVDLLAYEKAKNEFENMVNTAHDLFYKLEDMGVVYKAKHRAFWPTLKTEVFIRWIFFPLDDNAFLDMYNYTHIRKFVLAAGEILKQESDHGA